MDISRFRTYVYSPQQADAHWQRQKDLKREHLAILLDDQVIGENVIKNIGRKQRCCTLGIHMENDSVKNKGFGTKAEILALNYAFESMQIQTVCILNYSII